MVMLLAVFCDSLADPYHGARCSSSYILLQRRGTQISGWGSCHSFHIAAMWHKPAFLTETSSFDWCNVGNIRLLLVENLIPPPLQKKCIPNGFHEYTTPPSKKEKKRVVFDFIYPQSIV